ncbi:S-layer homology domain-containing protein [Sporosarcina siberiensis]|uniref:S-layer homology domain-containing protein n=1 Tax=Sporosarcina siberiensis TaxID=1365606 RepID=A0ABW4SJL7_9BACL
MVAGQTATTFAPDAKITRGELAVLLVKAYGLEKVNVDNVELPFTDVAEGMFYEKSIKILHSEGLIKGQSATKFGPKEDMKRGDFAWLSANLDYVHGEKLPKPVEEVVTATKVVSVSATNLKEVTVTFDGKVEATEDNFLIDGVAVHEDNFKLSDDKKTVTLFNAATPKQGQKVKVAVQNIANIDTKLYDVVVSDSQLPQVASVETVGNELVKITFTEPIATGTASISNFKINNAVRSGAVTLSNMNKTVNIALSSPLADGEYTLVVDPTNVKDFAAYSIGLNESKFTVTKDAALPGYTVVSSTQQEVKIKFDREVKAVSPADMDLYWTNNGTKHYATESQSTLDPSVWTFSFTEGNRLPSGENTLKIDKVVDFSGNSKVDYEVKVNSTVDTVRPEYQSVKQVNARTLEFKFSKAVELNVANYTVTDSKGVALGKSGVAYKGTDKTTVVLTLTSDIRADRNPYSITIKDVIDTTYLKNKITDTTVSLDTEDKVAPTVVGNAVRSGNIISITFSEDINQSEVDLSNFRYSTTNGSTFETLPATSYIEFVGTKTVNITLPANFGPSNSLTAASLLGGSNFYVVDVKDLAGNKNVAKTLTVANAAATVSAGTVMAHDTKTLYFEPSVALANVFNGDFVVTAGSKTLKVANAELVTADDDVNKLAKTGTGHDLTGVAVGDQLVKITLEDALNADGKYTVDGTSTAVTISTKTGVDVTKSALGVPLSITNASVTDKIVSAAPVKANFSFINAATDKLNITSAFITNENVKVEFLVSASSDVSALPATVANPYSTFGNSGVGTVFTVGTTTEATVTPTIGDKLYVRYIDVNLNTTAWVNIDQDRALAPSATFTYATKTIGSVTDVHEYSVDNGTWVAVPTGATSVVLASNPSTNVKVRVAATATLPASDTQTITIGSVLAAPTGVAIAAATITTGATKLTGVATDGTVEYSINGGIFVNIANAAAADDIAVNVGDSIVVRYAAVNSTPPSNTTAPIIVVAGNLKP